MNSEQTGASAAERLPTIALPDHFRMEGRPPVTAPARFVATDTRTGERVFVKWNSTADSIRREAEILSAVEGAGVARLKDWRVDPDGAWLAMEYVDGTTLEAFLAESGGSLGAAAVAGLLKRLTDTVSEIHAKGFLHRDLKPANIVIRRDATPVIIDFGAARVLVSGGSGEELPALGLLTEGYGAPEQYLTDKPEGAWTDVYGLGAIAYRALTGKAPPPALERLGDETGSLMGDLPEDCPVGLARSLDWALQPDPAHRPRTVAAWSAALSGAPSGAQSGARSGKSPKTRLVAAFDPQVDDYPPTIRVQRVPLESVTPATLAAKTEVAAPSPKTGIAASRRRSRGPMIAAILVCGLVAALGAATWYGWPLYERYLKQAWTVDPSGAADAPTIADALSRAGPGAIITIAPGTYRESLVIDYPVQLLAAAEDNPPVVAPAEGPCLVSVNSGAVITNLRLLVPAADEPPLSPVACVVVAGGRVILEKSHISSKQGPAILIKDGANPVIAGNTIEGGDGVGIVVASGATGTISGNTLKNLEKQSFVVRSGAGPDINDNTIEASGGVVFTDGAKGTFRGNRIFSARANAIEVMAGADPLVVDNMIKDAAEAGVFVYDHGKGRFEGNAIVASTLSGIVVAGGGTPVLVGNSVRENGEHGVLVLDRSKAVLERNAVERNKGHALVISPVSSVELTDNAFEGNKDPQVLDTRPPR